MKLIDNIHWKMEPLDHQKRIVSGSMSVLKESGFSAYFCEVGTRKTAMSITVAMNLAIKGFVDSIIIACPNSLYQGWVDELRRHADFPELPMQWYLINPKTQKSVNETIKQLNGNFPIFIVNYDAFSHDNDFLDKILNKFKTRKTILIMDESHKLKVHDSNRTKAMIKVSNQYDFRLIMTGTEIPSGISNIWSQFECLERGFWKNRYGIGNFTCFRSQFEIMGKFKLPNGNFRESPKQVKFMKDYERERYEKGLKEVNAMIEPFTFRAKREDCFDLPDRETIWLDFDLGKEERRVFDELKKDLMTELNGNLMAIISPITLFMRFRQIARGFIGEITESEYGKSKTIHEIVKTPSAITALLEHVESHDENEIIHCAFTHDVLAVAKALEPFGEVVKMYGEQSTAENQKAKTAFSNGDVRFIVGNQKMLSTGHNFQYHCAMSLVYSPSTDNEAWGQHEGRVYRSGQLRKTQFFRMRARHTADKRLYDILEGNLNTQAYFAGLSLKDVIGLLD